MSTLEHIKYKVVFLLKFVVPCYALMFLIFCMRSRTLYDVMEINRGEITYIGAHVMESGFNKWAEPDVWFYNLSTEEAEEPVIMDLMDILDAVRLRAVWPEGMYRDPLTLSSVDEQHAVSVMIDVGAGEEYICLMIGGSGNVHIMMGSGEEIETKGYRFTDSRMLDEVIAYMKEYGEIRQ